MNSLSLLRTTREILWQYKMRIIDAQTMRRELDRITTEHKEGVSQMELQLTEKEC